MYRKCICVAADDVNVTIYIIYETWRKINEIRVIKYVAIGKKYAKHVTSQLNGTIYFYVAKILHCTGQMSI